MSVFIKYIGLFWITVLFPIFTLHAQVDSSILAMADWVKAYNHFGKYIYTGDVELGRYLLQPGIPGIRQAGNTW